MRPAGSIVVALLGLALCVGCPTAPIANVNYPAPPPLSELPLEWQPDLLVEQHFPVLPPATEEEQKAAGRAFMLRSLRVDAQALLTLNEQTIVQTDARGNFGATRYRLVRKSDDRYELTTELVRPDFQQRLVMELNRDMRLLRYESRRALLLAGENGETIERVSYVRAIWKSEITAYVTTNNDGAEQTVTCAEPLPPMELLPLMALLAPPEALRADIPVFSAALGGQYRGSIEVRPGKTAGASRQLVIARALAPLGDDYSMIVETGAQAALINGRLGEALRLYPGSANDFDRVAGLGAWIRKERDRLMFNTAEIFSRLNALGAPVEPTAEGRAPAGSWLIVPVDDLDLMIGNSVPETRTQLIGLADRASLKGERSNPSRVGAGESGSPTSNLRLAEGERRCTVGLDILLPGHTLE
ncbi:MAG: hypothetical protein L6Q71_04820, partial [Planctomycetes bacterium]|nr:hypothetical protein [Planctomycetota bacterium]